MICHLFLLPFRKANQTSLHQVHGEPKEYWPINFDKNSCYSAQQLWDAGNGFQLEKLKLRRCFQVLLFSAFSFF